MLDSCLMLPLSYLCLRADQLEEEFNIGLGLNMVLDTIVILLLSCVDLVHSILMLSYGCRQV